MEGVKERRQRDKGGGVMERQKRGHEGTRDREEVCNPINNGE